METAETAVVLGEQIAVAGSVGTAAAGTVGTAAVETAGIVVDLWDRDKR